MADLIDTDDTVEASAGAERTARCGGAAPESAPKPASPPGQARIVTPDLSNLDVAPPFRGFVEDIHDGVLTGWCIATGAHDRPVEIDVLIDGEPVGRCRTAAPRRDLSKILGRDVKANFHLDLLAVDRALLERLALPRGGGEDPVLAVRVEDFPILLAPSLALTRGALAELLARPKRKAISSLADLHTHPRYRGSLDDFRDDALLGWCVDIEAPATPVELGIYIEDVLIGTTQTGLDRPDISKLVGTQVAAGFRFRVTDIREDIRADAVGRLRAAAEVGPLPEDVITIRVLHANMELERGALLSATRDLATAIATAFEQQGRSLRTVTAPPPPAWPALDDPLRRIFHGPFYRLLHPESGRTDDTAFEHFKAVGIDANLRPHPLFDPQFYFKIYPDVAANGMPAILHYLRYGGREWRKFSPFVDTDAYWENYRGEVALTETSSALEDFALSPRRSSAFAFFDLDFYLERSGCGDLPFNRALEHFFAVGLATGIDPHPLIEIRRLVYTDTFGERFQRFEALFLNNSLQYVATHPMVDPTYYIERYGQQAVHPVLHFLRYGLTGTALTPHPLFDPAFYCRTYGTSNSASAFTAYLRRGMDETCPNSLFDPVHYRSAYGHVIRPGVSALEHYFANGALPWFDPSPRFAQRYYLGRYPEVEKSGKSALAHFLQIGRNKGYAAMPPAPCLDQTRGLDRASVVEAIRSRGAGRLVGPPEVSVVVSVYGQLDVTLRCILSILQSADKTQFEILVVDDRSPDRSGAELAAALEGMPGFRVILNETNLGFLRSCNTAAATATAPFLYFLNNDTIVLDGWMDELVRTFRDEPEAGLVGAKLVYPDGRLQEAGGVVWSDGSAANYGRLDDPQAPAYTYMRDVDYVSGAAILISAKAWQDVGGFSDILAPAYYEDTDVAMKLRAAGWRVLYQPLAVVVHVEGVSSGTDLGTGMKRYQVVNRETFRSAWRETLAAYGNSGDLSRAAVDRKARARILFFDAEVPTPDRDSGSITTLHYLRILTRLGYRVTFIAETVQRYGRYGSDLQRFGVEVLAAPYVQNATDYILARGGEYDMIVLARAPIGGKILTAVKAAFPTTPIVFDTVDLHHLRMMRQFEQTGDRTLLAEAHEMKRIELAAIAAADATLLVSETEVSVIREEIGPFPHVVIPLIYQPYTRSTGFAERRDVAFVGGFRHTPNVDAVEFLAREIWPKVRVLPGMEGVRLHIIGSQMTSDVRALAEGDILTVGYVEDLETYFERIRLTVAPLRYGAGVKGKIGNSLRLGVPVVATPLAVEGMHIEDGRHALVAAASASFAESIRRLYEDEALWERLSLEGKALADQRFGLATATERFRTVCNALIGGRTNRLRSDGVHAVPVDLDATACRADSGSFPASAATVTAT